MTDELQNQIEALLFSAGGKMHVEELAKITKSKIDKVKEALVGLKQSYDDKSGSLMLANEGDSWKIAVKETYLNLVRNIVSETELSKTIMETLAVIAFKYPIKQSDLIAIRTNKAYDHLRELENMGYITRQKHGRTNLIKLTQKFFEYFDLREEQLKDKFQDFRSIADAIENKEKEIEEIKEKQKEEASKEKTIEEQEQDIQNQIDSLEEYDSPDGITEVMEEEKPKLGNLDVVDEPSDEEYEKEKKKREVIKKKKKEEEEKKHLQEHTFEGPGIHMTDEMEDVVDEKIEHMLHPEEPEEEKNEEPEEEQPEDAPEPSDLLEAAMHASQKQKDQPKKEEEEKKDDDVPS